MLRNLRTNLCGIAVDCLTSGNDQIILQITQCTCNCLDVYKRQVYAFFRFQIAVSVLAVYLEGNGLDARFFTVPVSYTHLDVYKRQVKHGGFEPPTT